MNAFATGTILTNAQQTGEFDNIYNNALTLISPLTGNLNANSKQITNFVLENAAASKVAATAGIAYFQTTANLLEVDDGAAIRRMLCTTTATLTANRIPYAAASNLHTYSANLTYDGTSFVVGTAGPHAIGGATNALDQLVLKGAFVPSASGGSEVDLASSITLGAGFDFGQLILAGQITTAASGTSANIRGIQLSQSIVVTVGSTVTDISSLWAGPPAITNNGTLTNASTVKITGAPSGATNNYALWIVSGGVRIGSLAAFAAGDKYVIVDANGNLHVSGLGPLS